MKTKIIVTHVKQLHPISNINPELQEEIAYSQFNLAQWSYKIHKPLLLQKGSFNLSSKNRILIRKKLILQKNCFLTDYPFLLMN
jgi:hypothetical protein